MWQKNVRYLDYNASAGIAGRVRNKLIDSLKNGEDWLANPSSRHRAGQRESHLLFDSARVISGSLGKSVTPDDLVFTSSGTEANQTVLRSFARSGMGLVVGAGEHPASHDLIPELRSQHPLIPVLTLPLLSSGAYDLARLPALLREAKAQGAATVGISLFWANNETGVLTNIEELSRVLSDAPVEWRLHLDGAQVWGKVEIDVERTPAHFVTFSSHKIGAPAGTGVIWSRREGSLHPLITGSQNRGSRGGSENLLGIRATAFATEELSAADFEWKTAPLRDRLEQRLAEALPGTVFFGAGSARVPNTSRIGFPGFSAYENWVELLDLRGFAVSHGSACKAKIVEPSRVLLEMGVPRELALNSIRVSFSPSNSEQDVDDLVDALLEIHASKGRSSA
ncbi:MAG: aminotransferase class V-fold PLP-dependent enzyme [Proteobacteria bacterium]|nr:aminotransferase class V-fold PLP-dependent enzyme [Pseudomonadota bacterium]